MKHGCTHRGITKVMELGKAEIYAGSWREADAMRGKVELVINLLGKRREGERVLPKMDRSTSRTLPGLAKFIRQREAELVLEWPDMSVPHYDLEFWKHLVEDVKKVEGKVVVHCMGGHGRTGTLLAIMAYLGEVNYGVDPVKWVRARYCTSSVETGAQVTYLREVVGMETKAEGSSFGHLDYKSKGSVFATGTNVTKSNWDADGRSGKYFESAPDEGEDSGKREKQWWKGRR